MRGLEHCITFGSIIAVCRVTRFVGGTVAQVGPQTEGEPEHGRSRARAQYGQRQSADSIRQVCVGSCARRGKCTPLPFGVTLSPVTRFCPPPPALQPICTRRILPPNHCSNRQEPPLQAPLQPLLGPVPSSTLAPAPAHGCLFLGPCCAPHIASPACVEHATAGRAGAAFSPAAAHQPPPTAFGGPPVGCLKAAPARRGWRCRPGPPTLLDAHWWSGVSVRNKCLLFLFRERKSGDQS